MPPQTSADQHYLFEGSELEDLLENRLSSVFGLVEKIALAELQSTPLDVLQKNLLLQLTIKPLVLHTDHAQVSYHATTITDPNVKDYGIYGGPVVQDAEQLRVVIAFSGDAQLWHAHPLGTRNSMALRGTVDAAQSTLTLTFDEVSGTERRMFERRSHRMQESIRLYLNMQAEELAKYERNLVAVVHHDLTQRSLSI